MTYRPYRYSGTAVVTGIHSLGSYSCMLHVLDLVPVASTGSLETGSKLLV